MINQHHTLKLIKEYMTDEGLLIHEINNLTEIKTFFEYLNNSKKKFNSAYLLIKIAIITRLLL